MATHTSGSGSTITGTSQSGGTTATKERYVYGLLAKLEDEENNLTRVTGRNDSITLSVNYSSKIATFNLNLNVTAATLAGGDMKTTATHYLTGSTFTSGTGGSSTAANLSQAVMEGLISLKLLELDTSKNPQNLSNIQTCQVVLATSGTTNATFSASGSFPVEIVQLPGGGTVIEGKTWLL